MPMQRTQIDVPLSAGLQQKQAFRDVEVSGAISMTNCVMLKNGSVQKRAGMNGISSNIQSGGAIATATMGGAYRQTPWLIDGEHMFSYAASIGSWETRDVVPDAVALDRVAINSFTSVIADMDQAAGNGFLVVVYEGDPLGLGFQNLFYMVLDLATYVVLVQTQRVDTSNGVTLLAPRLIVCGTTVVLTCVNAGQIQGYTFSLSSIFGGWSAATTMTADAVGNTSQGVYDSSAVAGDATRMALAYEVSNSGNHVAIKTFTVSGLSLATAQFDEGTYSSLTGIACVATNSEYHWAVYAGNNSGTLKLRAWAWQDSSPSTHVAPFDVYTYGADVPGRVVAVRTDGTHITPYWSPSITPSNNNGTNLGASYVRTCLLSTAGTASRISITNPVLLTTKPIATNGTAYIGVQTCSTEQGTAFLARDDGWNSAPAGANLRGLLRAVATLDPRLEKYTTALTPQGNFYQVAWHIVPNPLAGSGNVWLLPVFESTSPSHQAIYDHQIDLGSSETYFSAELYEEQAITAGVPSVYDGQVLVEQNFLVYPEIASTSFAGTGGHLQTSGTYQYVAVYEWYDHRGQLTQSGTSDPVSVTATGSGNTGQCTVTVPGLSFTRRQQDPNSQTTTRTYAYIIIYRTQANGGTFYRVTPDPPGVLNQVNQGFTVSYVDNASDASIATNALLYTTGGNLTNLNPPSARCLVQHTNRWYFAGTPDPTALWCTKALTTGILPACNEQFNVTCSGAIRALASMDGNLIIFVQRGTAYGIETMAGLGPTDGGTQDDRQPPQIVPSDSGAIDQRGVCVGPFGCLYRSPVGGPNGTGGIFLLARDLQVSYVSRGVEDLLAVNSLVTSMVVHPTNGRVYITAVQPGAPSNGVRLVWDYVQGGLWSVDTVNGGTGAATSWIASNGTVPTVWQARANGIFQEIPDGSSYLDNGSFVPMTYTSAWIKPSKSGFARFWRVLVSADSKEVANFSVQLTFDYAPSGSYNELASWTSIQASSFTLFPIIDVAMTPNNQKAKSIQVTFSDAQGSSMVTGQGFTLAGLSLDIGVKEGPWQNVPFAQRA